MLTTSLLIGRERNWRLYAENLQDALEARDVTIDTLYERIGGLMQQVAAANDEVRRLERLLKAEKERAARLSG